MTQLVFASTATQLMQPADLVFLLEEVRARCERLNVTGMSLYHEGSFLHVLEGDEETVTRLYATFDSNGYHKGITMLMQLTVPEREFSDWSMSWRRNPTDPDDVPDGYRPFMEKSVVPDNAADPGPALQALLNFRNLEDEGGEFFGAFLSQNRR